MQLFILLWHRFSINNPAPEIRYYDGAGNRTGPGWADVGDQAYLNLQTALKNYKNMVCANPALLQRLREEKGGHGNGKIHQTSSWGRYIYQFEV